jgi:hypothetical protein
MRANIVGPPLSRKRAYDHRNAVESNSGRENWD